MPGLVGEHGGRIRTEINRREAEEIGRLEAEYQPHADKLAGLERELTEAREVEKEVTAKSDKIKAAKVVGKLEKQRDKERDKATAKIAERDQRIAEIRRSAEDDRADVSAVADELVSLYGDPDELIKHARVVDLDEIEENEFNLNVPRYVDTFEPEPRIEVRDALKALQKAEAKAKSAEEALFGTLQDVGYAIDQ